jgi:hypothetical protein
VSFSRKRFAVIAAWGGVLATNPSPALSQNNVPPPLFHPLPIREFHFSDPARDAEFRRLERESERRLAVARNTLNQARGALKQPAPAPGTPAWLEARALVEQAILARRPFRDAQLAVIEFLIRERPKLSPPEAAEALYIWRMREEFLRATSDNLVDLLAGLADIKIGQWPP